MAWVACTLTYRAMSPLLLGSHPLGFIQRTRLYAPGWTLWGAITAQLTRTCFQQATGEEYEETGRFVAHNLPTSYAYILLDEAPAWPHFEQGEWYYGKLPAARFEARFLSSLGQTAVAPANLAADAGTLHETEVLVARDPESGAAVRWQFTLYARCAAEGCSPEGDWTPCRLQDMPDAPPELQGMTLQTVLHALQELRLGADSGYGLGWLVCEPERTTCRLLQGDGEWPQPVDWDGAKRTLRAHVPLSELPGDMVRGRAEAIPWRWWQNEAASSWGPGQKREVQSFYAPGSEVLDPAWRPVVGPKGIWHRDGWRDAAATAS